MREETFLRFISIQLSLLSILICVMFVTILFRPTVTVSSDAANIKPTVSNTTASLMKHDTSIKARDIKESDIKILDSIGINYAADKTLAENSAIIMSTQQFKAFMSFNNVGDYSAALLTCREKSSAVLTYTFVVANTDIAFDVDVDILGGCQYSECYNVYGNKYPIAIFTSGIPKDKKAIYTEMLNNGLHGMYAISYVKDSNTADVLDINTGENLLTVDVR